MFLPFFGLLLATSDLPTGYPTVPIRGVSGKPVRMPMIGLGTWLYPDAVAQSAVTTAFSLGYRHVDTAFGYKNQGGVGQGLQASRVPREEYFITTKVPGGLNASATKAALDESLALLRTTYVDLMLIHYPGSDSASRKEQWLALEQWALSGKARAIGVSHYCRTHIEEVMSVSHTPIAVNQNQYHVGMGRDTQPRLHDRAFDESQGILFEAYSTLCGPCDYPGNETLLTGPLVTRIGRAHNKTGAQVSLRWAVQQGIPVIPKSSTAAHLRENFELFDFALTAEEMAVLSSATSPAETGTTQNPDDAQDCSFERPAIVRASK